MSGKPMHVVSSRPKSESSPEEISQRAAAELARIGRFIAKIQEAGFYGKLTISFQSGKIVDVRTEQTLKLEEL